jgi:uncharacterized protein (DUF885 family)
MFDAILESLWAESPTAATSIGVHDHDHRLIDCAPESIDARLRLLSAHWSGLAGLLRVPASLTADQELDARVLLNHLEVEEKQLREIRAPFRDPGYYLDEIMYGVYYLIQRTFAPLPERAHRAAARLREVPRLLRQAATNLVDPSQVAPVWVEAALRQARASLQFLATLGRELAPRAASAGADLLAGLGEAQQAIRAFAEFLEARFAGKACGDYAVGRPLFEALLRSNHGLDPDAEALRRFGIDLIARTEEKLAEAARRIEPNRTWQELVAGWKADHPTRREFLSEYQREAQRLRDFVLRRDLVTFPEGERLHVMETPSFQRAVCPFAAYLAPGAFEAEQEGFFWVTPPDEEASPDDQARLLQDHMRPGITGTVAHEAYPGHHLQLSLANRIESKVRRALGTPIMVEGWAFYCEQMIAEQGGYDDPRSGVLQLKDELWRACRVVIDVGLQTRGMTVDEAVTMLHEVARLEIPSARSEVLRYTRSPTQPMSYAAGKYAILGLRDECRGRLGPAFSLRGFHDAFLSFGSIPVAMIRERMIDGARPAVA